MSDCSGLFLCEERIAKEFYRDPNEYMRIFYANHDKLSDPDKINVGQQLTIPKA
jgi:nucleoid-associated protein YgaU